MSFQAMLKDRDALLRQLHELRSEHRDLDTVISRLADQGALDQLQLQRLKKRKLLIKDEVSRLESNLIPDNIA
ncbi:putative cytosolic protein [Granulibacter bethesdensis]|uniref:Cytosolic protein n=1 Tax=Granulibacter bethesdensis TaxID=364410 RepID=A0AAN0VFV7_9PROT|nr:putative cytosolic protein [Granulibacter bethesdensis]AHJ66190.1 putative cytosolic protein [Granulibacter bethesdensis CGDNIH4]APH57180.1 putative cytosolic protein [Granulibacter bethesdensis]APH59695.1 putative cytosolic protein [Granulibacter bethesdensis]